MRMTESMSFWVIIFSLIIACLIGSVTHWIFGILVFFILAGKSALISIIHDSVSGFLEYHHNRQDLRAKKILASMRYIAAAKAGARPVQNSITKLINIRR